MTVYEMDTLKQRDEILLKLWQDFADIPMNPETECIEEDFMCFPAGTDREDIWHWFDERYSKGISDLLYSDGMDRTVEIARLCYLKQLCDDCESDWCAYNSDGLCKFALIHGRKPEWSDHEGCVDCAVKRERANNQVKGSAVF